MKYNNLKLIVGVSTFFACTVAAGTAMAQNLSERNIKIVVPYSAGGGNDSFARALQKPLEDILDTTVTIQNIAGGGGVVGFTHVLAAKPDGFTVTIPNNAIFTLQGMGNATFEYDDFDYVARITAEPYVLTANPGLGWEGLDDVVSTDGPVRIGFPGVGSSAHIMAVAIAESLGVDTQMVPYGGDSDALAAAMGGHIDAVVSAPIAIASAVEGGQLSGLATTDKSALLEGVPTFSDQGYDVTTMQWRGIAAPSGLEPEIKQQWIEALQQALDDPAFQQVMINLGAEVAPLYGDELNEFVDQTAADMVPLAEQLRQ